MEERGGDKGEVDRVERITVVRESFVSQRWDGQAFLHIAWHDPRKEELVEDETGIHLPRVEVRAGILHERGKLGKTIGLVSSPKGEELTSRM